MTVECAQVRDLGKNILDTWVAIKAGDVKPFWPATGDTQKMLMTCRVDQKAITDYFPLYESNTVLLKLPDPVCSIPSTIPFPSSFLSFGYSLVSWHNICSLGKSFWRSLLRFSTLVCTRMFKQRMKRLSSTSNFTRKEWRWCTSSTIWMVDAMFTFIRSEPVPVISQNQLKLVSSLFYCAKLKYWEVDCDPSVQLTPICIG